MTHTRSFRNILIFALVCLVLLLSVKPLAEHHNFHHLDSGVQCVVCQIFNTLNERIFISNLYVGLIYISALGILSYDAFVSSYCQDQNLVKQKVKITS